MSDPRRGLERRLLRSHMRVAGLALALMLLALAFTLWQRHHIIRFVDLRTATVEASLVVEAGLRESEALLASWLATKAEQHNEQRLRVWDARIRPALDRLQADLTKLGDHHESARLSEALPNFDAVEGLQWWVEDLSRMPGNRTALTLVRQRVDPVARSIDTLLGQVAEAASDSDVLGAARGRAALGGARLALDRSVLNTAEAGPDVASALAEFEALVGALGTEPGEGPAAIALARLRFELPALRRFAMEAVALAGSDRRDLVDAMSAAQLAPALSAAGEAIGAIQNGQRDKMLAESTDVRVYSNVSVAVSVLLMLALFVAARRWSLSTARGIVTPVRRLQAAAGALADGHLHEDIPIERDDEVGALTESFNQMRAALEGSRERLVDSEAERRAAAEATAAEMATLAADLRTRADVLMEVTSRAAKGDLTVHASVSGDDAIGHLATGLQTMIEGLRELAAQLQRSGSEIVAATHELARASRGHQEETAAQAASAAEISATSTEIAMRSQSLNATAQELVRASDDTAALARDGQQALVRMRAAVRQTTGHAAIIGSKLDTLQEKAESIERVIATVTMVADQTNLLSLNAAIEAEKAGEAGRGFGVVAVEIRRLADQTAVATIDIELMVHEMMSAVMDGARTVKAFAEAARTNEAEIIEVSKQLESIVTRAQEIAPRFGDVQAGVEAQAEAATQIAMMMKHLGDGTQATAERIEILSGTLAALESTATELQSAAGRFSITRG